VYDYFPNLGFLAVHLAPILVLTLRLEMWDFIRRLAGSNPSSIVLWVLGGWVALFGAAAGFEVTHHKGPLASMNIVQVGLVNVWAFVLAYEWIFLPLLENPIP
jgi:hypothetical protein